MGMKRWDKFVKQSILQTSLADFRGPQQLPHEKGRSTPVPWAQTHPCCIGNCIAKVKLVQMYELCNKCEPSLIPYAVQIIHFYTYYYGKSARNLHLGTAFLIKPYVKEYPQHLKKSTRLPKCV